MPQSQYPDPVSTVIIDGGLSGLGSPEGVVTASPGKTYTDASVDPPGFWTKFSGVGSIGWRQVAG